MPKKDNIARLVDAEVLDPTDLSDRDRGLINDLTPDEVAALISVRKKVGDYSSKTRRGPCAWML